MGRGGWAVQLPAGWSAAVDGASGRTYYVHAAVRASGRSADRGEGVVGLGRPERFRSVGVRRGGGPSRGHRSARVVTRMIRMLLRGGAGRQTRASQWEFPAGPPLPPVRRVGAG